MVSILTSILVYKWIHMSYLQILSSKGPVWLQAFIPAKQEPHLVLDCRPRWTDYTSGIRCSSCVVGMKAWSHTGPFAVKIEDRWLMQMWYFSLLFLINLQNIPKDLFFFLLCHCGELCVGSWEREKKKMSWIHFKMSLKHVENDAWYMYWQ